MDSASFATAYALSTVAGIRPFVTLALASLAVHFGLIHLARAYAGLGTDGATVVLLGLAAIELLADKIPGVDHVLHVAHFATKPLAAALIVGSTVSPDVPSSLAILAAGLGALNAVGVHTGMTAVRGGSSAMTLGLANPVLSFGEDVVTTILFALAFAVPAAGAALALAFSGVVLTLAVLAFRAIARRRVS